MKLHFEFLTVFRWQTGRQRLTIELPDRGGAGMSVVEALAGLQGCPQGGQLRLLERGRVAPGLLVFRKTPAGGLERLIDPEDQRVAPGQCLVLSVAMEGG